VSTSQRSTAFSASTTARAEFRSNSTRTSLHGSHHVRLDHALREWAVLVLSY